MTKQTCSQLLELNPWDAKKFVMINDPTMSALMGFEIDAYINPRATTVSSILRILYTVVRNVYSIGDAEAEIIEAQVGSTSPIAGSRIGTLIFQKVLSLAVY